METLETLDALQSSVLDRRRRTPVPTSFLVDRERRVAAIYKGPVDVDTLLADVARLGARPDEQRDRVRVPVDRLVPIVPNIQREALEIVPTQVIPWCASMPKHRRLSKCMA